MNTFEIQNGTAIDATWKGLIAFRPVGGGNWSTIPKNDLRVEVTNLNYNSNDPNAIKSVDAREQIVLRSTKEPMNIYARFTYDEATSQTWTDTADAIGDINGWIGEIYP